MTFTLARRVVEGGVGFEGVVAHLLLFSLAFAAQFYGSSPLRRAW
jgi:hypothetical protein